MYAHRSSPSARSPLRAQFCKPAADGVTAAYGAGTGATSSSSRSSSRWGAPAAPPPRPVRSSGYGPTPGGSQRQLFVPVTNKHRRREAHAHALPETGLWGGSASGGEPGSGGGLLSRVGADLMRSWKPPLQQCGKASLWHDFGTAVRLSAAGESDNDGDSLATRRGNATNPSLTLVPQVTAPAWRARAAPASSACCGGPGPVWRTACASRGTTHVSPPSTSARTPTGWWVVPLPLCMAPANVRIGNITVSHSAALRVCLPSTLQAFCGQPCAFSSRIRIPTTCCR